VSGGRKTDGLNGGAFGENDEKRWVEAGRHSVATARRQGVHVRRCGGRARAHECMLAHAFVPACREEIIKALPSNTTEDMDSNASTLVTWIRANS
jgi:hypothetical protein